MKFKKIVCVICALLLFVTTISGCSTKKESSKTGQGKIKLSYASWVTGPVKDNSMVEQKLEQKFPDVDFVFIPFERETWQQQLNTRVAGGDIPDIIYRDHVYYVIEYAKQNLIAEVPFETVKQYAPDITKATMDYGTSVWLSCNVDGKNYGLPMMQPNQSYPSTDAWRKDWLNNVGINKIPETLDEYEEALRRFANNDPDKNGQKDTYGLSFNAKSSPSFMFKTIFSAYNTLPGTWMFDENGKIIYGSVTPQAKEALTKLNKWYSEGLIDPEFITTDTAALKQKWVNGKIGFMPNGTWYRLIPSGEYYEGVKAVNPQAEVEMGPAPKGPDGHFGYGLGQEGDGGAITSSIVFAKKLESEPEKLHKAIQIVNTMMSDSDIYSLLKYGVEGENWKRDSHNGVELNPPYNLPQNCADLGTNLFASFYATPEVQTKYTRNDIDEITKFAKMGNVHKINIWVDYFVSQDNKKLGDNAQLVADKWLANFIVGKEPLTKFDQYVEEWYAAGGRPLTDAFNQAYLSGKETMKSILSQVE